MQRLQRRLIVDSNPVSHGQLDLGICKTLILFTKIFYGFQIYIHVYRMAKIYWHITKCNAGVWYFVTLHAFMETYKTQNIFTLTFIQKSKRRRTMRRSSLQKSLLLDVCQLLHDRIIV